MSVDSPAARPQISTRDFWRILAISVFPVALLVMVPFGIARLFSPLRGIIPSPGAAASLVCLVPFVQGLSFGGLGARFKVGPLYIAAGLAIFVIDLLLAAFPLREGVICLVIASPLLLAAIAIGLGVGVARLLPRRIVQSGFVPLAILAGAYQAASGPSVYPTSVVDTMTIEAPPDYVWRYIVSYPENDAPADYWLWRIGLPLPTRSVATAAAVGATRECRFSKGIALKERITELVPNKVVTFDVVEQPDDPEILGHLSLDRGQLSLQANPDGSTTVIATTWYRVFVTPALYADWWAKDIGRNVHRRVVGRVKRLAEADWRRDRIAAK